MDMQIRKEIISLVCAKYPDTKLFQARKAAEDFRLDYDAI